MGLMGRILGAGGAAREVGAAVTGIAEVFAGNRAQREAAEAGQLTATLGEYAAEFTGPRTGWFDGFVNGLNRLPRPMLAISTLALFGYAMAEPAGFSVRMRGLELVPEPLWWLLGAIVSFYFGARELHYRRESVAETPPTPVAITATTRRVQLDTPPELAPAAPAAPDQSEEDDQASLFGFWRTSPKETPTPAAATARNATLAPKATPVVAVHAADPNFNAAVEEWRRLNG